MAIMLITLWVRSYSKHEAFGGPISPKSSIEFASVDGRVYVTVFRQPKPEWRSHTYRPGRFGLTTLINHRRSFAGFKFYNDNANGTLFFRGVAIPHWALLLVCGVIGALSWRDWRFSLRVLLIAMTLLALAFGLLIWAVS
jgi:hypothetical protein